MPHEVRPDPLLQGRLYRSRGRFDYSSLNTNELEGVAAFSLLVLSDNDGAAIREAKPPKQ